MDIGCTLQQLPINLNEIKNVNNSNDRKRTHVSMGINRTCLVLAKKCSLEIKQRLTDRNREASLRTYFSILCLCLLMILLLGGDNEVRDVFKRYILGLFTIICASKQPLVLHIKLFRKRTGPNKKSTSMIYSISSYFCHIHLIFSTHKQFSSFFASKYPSLELVICL